MNIQKINVNSETAYAVDVPVVINFFARPDTLKQVFERVREAKPSKLFLLADGPRKNVPTDAENVKKCRKIVENVDWQCELYHIYAEENQGLFDTYFKGMKLVFAVVDRCIFIEDDCLLSISYFRFCRDLLEKYENDFRIHFISSVNNMGVYNKPDGDYFFSGEGACPAYAIWKRTFESMNLDFVKNEYVVTAANRCARQLKNGYQKRINKTVKNPMWEGHVPHVEFYKNLLRFTQNQVYIVPTKNMLCNIGVSSNSVHTADNMKKLPKATQNLLNQESYEYDFPLKHPQYCVRDIAYEDYVNKVLGWNKPFRKAWRKLSALLRHIRYGDFKRICYKIKTLFIRDNWI